MNFDASTLMNGAPASLARRRAISVFPTPVGPMRMMLFGEISSRIAFGRALPAPAIAQRDGDGLLRVGLADDVAIELGDDLTRRQVGELGESLLGTSEGMLVTWVEGERLATRSDLASSLRVSRTVMLVLV